MLRVKTASEMENGCEYFYKLVEYTWWCGSYSNAEVVRSILTTLTVMNCQSLGLNNVMHSNKETSMEQVNQERREGRSVWHTWEKWKLSTEFWSVIVRVKNLLHPYQSHLCKIFGEQSGNGADFSPSPSVFPVILIPPMLNIHSSVIREQENGRISGRTRKPYIHRHAPPK